jgi:nicotinamide-nucleotide amidase
VAAVRVEIVAIGDELLLGLTQDTNSTWLAAELAATGIEVSRRTAVGDDVAEIQRAVAEALERSGGVITTGGLGPTPDDVTRPAVAALFGVPLRFDPDVWDRILRLWQRRGRPGQPPESNKVQAMVPEGALVLGNLEGTAPGLFLQDARGSWVALLPGVPREMRAIFSQQLVPLLRDRYRLGERVVRWRVLRTTGVAESRLVEMLGELVVGEGVRLAYLPGLEGVDLRVTVAGVTAAEADRLLESALEVMRARLGRFAYGEGNQDLAAVVLERCRQRQLHVAVGESCTGGLLGARLTAAAGSSDVFLGGVVAYANEAKVGMLGVSAELIDRAGAVSEEVALAMASGAAGRFGASVGIGVTGIAGPGGGTPDKPVGTVCIAVVGPGWRRSLHSVFPGDRAEIRFRATQAALDAVRQGLASG